MRPSRIHLPPYSLHEIRAGSGTPVALLHGLSGSSRWWSRNIDALAQRHLVAAVDLRGRALSLRESAALLARWVESLGDRVHLIGHSMGGQLAVRIAAEHPELVRSLVLVSAAGMPFHLDPRPHVRALPKPPYGGVSIARLLLPDLFRTGPASVALSSTRVVRDDVRALLRRLRVPVLLLWGENDPLVPLIYGEAMQREIEGARLEVIPRAAHVPMWDTPAEFNRIVLQFLDEVERVPPAEPAQPVFSWGLSGWANGIAHRQAGRARDVVLVHGLGMSSAYLERIAAELFARGWNPIAPDLPGFGESANARASGPREHAETLAAWADALSIRNAIWVGHSTGCNAVAHLAQLRPDLVRASVMVGPLWTKRRFVNARLFALLALDAFREPLSLYRFVIPAYWRVGIARWIATWRRYARDVGWRTSRPLPAGVSPDGIAPGTMPGAGGRDVRPPMLLIAGERDPIPDRTCMRIVHVRGAHACLFSHAAEVAEALPANVLLLYAAMTDWKENLVESQDGIAAIFRATKTIAVLGMKTEAQSDQPAFYVPEYLQRAGFDIIPVPVYYPDVTEILGQKVFRSLASIGRPIDMVDVFRRGSDVPPHVDDILAAKPKCVWMQSGIRNDEAARRFAEAGIKVVQDRCAMVEHRRVR